MTDDLQQKKALKEAHRRRLHYLELRAAQHGSAVDPAILVEINDINNKIAELTAEIERADRALSKTANSNNLLEYLLEENILVTKQVTRSYKPPQDRFAWIKIPAGEFLMGGDREKDPKARDVEIPQHRVYLSEFWISRFPITNQQYKQFVDDTGYTAPYHWKDGEIPKGKELHPVVYVSWRDAELFCEWAQIRLPTEAEWEKAARGIDGRIYPWGNSAPHRALCNFSNTNGTTPVGIYKQGVSPFGVFDMAGNTWDWTSSLWGQYTNKSDFPYPYKADDGRENLNAPDQYARIIRGGGFSYYEHMIRCAVRLYAHPLSVHEDVGFRAVRMSGFTSITPV